MENMSQLNCAHYQHGSQTKIAVVFSCPGLEEERQKLPTSGQTGVNLNKLINQLNHHPNFEEIQSKSDLRITNAWDKVLPNDTDKRTEAGLKHEIYSPPNLKRLHNELKDVTGLIITFGKKAQKALAKLSSHNLGLDADIISSRHLGLQSLNQISLNEEQLKQNYKKGEKTELRLQIVASAILEKLINKV